MDILYLSVSFPSKQICASMVQEIVLITYTTHFSLFTCSKEQHPGNHEFTTIIVAKQILIEYLFTVNISENVMCVWTILKKTKELQKFFFLKLTTLPDVLKIYVNYKENVLYFYCVF